MGMAENKKTIHDFSEAELFCEYKKTGSDKLRDIIVERYMYIPHSIAKRYALKTLDYDDLYQSACVGLMKALNSFDYESGNKFSTYATTWALGEVKHHLRDKGSYIKIPQRVYHIFYRAKKLREREYLKTGKYPTSEELAKSLNVLSDEVECALSWGENKIAKSLDQFMHEGEEMVYSDIIAIEDNSLLIVENKLFLENCFESLTDEEKTFLKYRYYDEMTQSEIANKMNVSQMKISRMEKKVISILKKMYFEY